MDIFDKKTTFWSRTRIGIDIFDTFMLSKKKKKDLFDTLRISSIDFAIQNQHTFGLKKNIGKCILIKNKKYYHYLINTSNIYIFMLIITYLEVIFINTI